MRMAGLGAALVLACGVAGLGAVPAKANCYEIYGCTDSSYFDAKLLTGASCQILWEMRNWIYKENGYCFRTPKAIEAFGNSGCRYDDVAQVPLNDIERHNMTTIKSVEIKKGC